MAQDTNLNVTPYFDDYDESKNYHRILFRPSYPIQARELTQLQSILQNQVERFGQNIYKTGTVISGCSVSADPKYNFVRFRDLDQQNFDVNIFDFRDCRIVDTSTGLQAVVTNVADGTEGSANNELKTAFVKYVNASSVSTQSTFTPGTAVFVQKLKATIEELLVSNSGVGYTNSMYVHLSQTTPSPIANAYGRIVTNSTGNVTDVTMIDKGEGYTKTPDDITSAVRYANGVSVPSSVANGVVFVVKNYVSQPVVASNGVGVGYGLKVSDGIIFQKGFFIRVDSQEVAVSKYLSTSSGYPNNVSVGFSTTETIVNSSVDSTLLDNASGFSNYQAPGANRLQLTPVLTVKTSAELSDVANGIPTVENFFSLVEFQGGNIVRDKTSVQFNAVDTELAKRTYEESGNYVVRPISIITEEAGDVYGSEYANSINVIVGKGVSYVQGHRNELTNSLRLSIPKANTTISPGTSNLISTSYGLYFSIPQEKWFGVANIQYGETVTLFANTVAVGNNGILHPGDNVPANLPATLGTNRVVGTAKVRSVLYNGFQGSISENKYNLYVFDLKINPGFSAANILSVGANSKFLAEISATNGITLNDPQKEPIIFPLGVTALASVTDDDFQYRRQYNDAAVSNTGLIVVQKPGDEQFLYSSGTTLDEVQKTDLVVICTNTIVSNTIASNVVVHANNLVVGDGSVNFVTAFGAYAKYGVYVKISNTTLSSPSAYYYPIVSVANSTHAYLPAYANISVANASLAYSYPKNSIVNPALFTANVDGSNVNITLVPWSNIASAGTFGNVAAIHTSVATPATTSLYLEDHYVKISNTMAATLSKGPWCLGIPNAVRLEGVWVGSGDTFASETDQNIRNNFTLEPGQKDSYYGLSYLKLRSDSVFELTSTKNLLVKVKCYRTNSSGDYITLESFTYPNNAPVPLEYVTAYRTSAGTIISLRDSIDFRPYISNTVSHATSAASARIYHASVTNATHIAYSSVIVESLSSAARKYPSPRGQYEADLTYFVPRRDRVVMDKNGAVRVLRGEPSLKPVIPPTPSGTLSLGELYIPPYPSYAYHKAVEVGRLDYSISVSTRQQTRFTMADIQKIEDRIDRLEYYTSFNLLESQTQALRITSESNNQIERFKNGFFVDSMKDGSFSEQPTTFTIDEFNEIATPIFKQIPLKLKVANTANTSTFDSIYSDASHVFLQATYSAADAKFDKPTSQRNLINGFVKFNGRIYVNPPYDVTATQGNGGLDSYIKAQTITIQVTGLMPNRKHYIFFDGVNITSECFLAASPITGNAVPHSSDEWQWEDTTVDASGRIVRSLTRIRNSGADPVTFTAGGLTSGWTNNGTKLGTTSLLSDKEGRITVQYRVPASTYTFGAKDVIVMDIDLLTSEDNATSIAKSFFYGFSSTVIPQQPPVIVAPSPSGGNPGGRVCNNISTESYVFLLNIWGEDVAQWAAANLDECTITWVGDKEYWGEIQRRLRGDNSDSVPDNRGAPSVGSRVNSPSDDVIVKPGTGGTTRDSDNLIGAGGGDGSLDNMDIGPGGTFTRQDTASKVYGNDDFTHNDITYTSGRQGTLVSDPAICSYGVDPIGQTFRSSADFNAGGKWVHSVKLLFARKSDPNVTSSILPYSGVSVEIRKTLNGYPTGPEGVVARTHLQGNRIDVLPTNAVSLDETKYTWFIFNEPVYLENNTEYAIVVLPDGNSTDYLAWTGVVGETVFATNKQYTTQDSVTPGVLFTSTNQTAWSAVQAEDLVYEVRVMQFDESTGHVTLVPNDYEFIKFESFPDKAFGYREEDMIGQLNGAYCNGSFKTDSGVLKTGPSTYQFVPAYDGPENVEGPWNTVAFSNSSFFIEKATTSDNFTNFAAGEGLIVLRVEPSMIKSVSSPNNKIITISGNTVTANQTAPGSVDPNYDVVLKVGDFVIIPNVSDNTTLFGINSANGEQHSCIRQVVAIANSSQFTIDAPIGAAVSNVGFWVANNVKTFVTTTVTSNNTHLNLKEPVPLPFVTFSNGTITTSNIDAANVAYSFLKAPVGRMEEIDAVANSIRIQGSTANSTVKFSVANSTYLGTVVSSSYTNTSSFSTAYSKVTGFNEYVIDRVSSMVRYFTPTGTRITPELTTKFSSANNDVVSVTNSVKMNAVTPLTYDASLKSKSVVSAADYPLVLKLNMRSESKFCSPKITTRPASIVVHTAQINSNTTNENYANNTGAALAKYVSKPSTLGTELDAEDIFVYVTAYRPAGTDVKVYVKVRAREDERKIKDVEWTELQVDTNGDVFSSTTDLSDYKEYRYTFRKKPETIVLAGSGSYTNNTSNLDGFGTTWDSGTRSANLMANDVIIIVDQTNPSVYDIGVVNSVTNSTHLVLKNKLSDQGVFTSPTTASLTVERVINPSQAFKYYGNDNIVRYYNASLGAFDTYQQFVVKVVMTRSQNGVVPYINDVRAIATSV